MASSASRVFNVHTKRLITAAYRHQRCFQPRCFIHTSKKNKDSASLTPTHPLVERTETPEEMFPSDPAHDKNWMSYGYSLVDKEMDWLTHNVVMFMAVTVGLIGGSFLVMYMPDHRLAEWSQRESHLELARRERGGLPLIDPNLIDVSKIDIPPEAELDDTEIII